MLRSILALLGLASFCVSAHAAPIGADSKLPVPRLESLKASVANGRRGPSLDQPALYRYRRPGLPMEVIGESGPWRRVRDPEGAVSWMRKELLSPTRTAMVAAEGNIGLRRRREADAPALAWLEPGVVARIVGCEGEWRRVSVAGRNGWLPADAIWGAGGCPATP